MTRHQTIKSDWLVFLMVMISSLVVLQISGISFFLLLQVVYCIYMFITTKKICVCRFPMINFIYIELIITALSAVVGNMRYSYKKSALIITIMAIPLYFVVSYLYEKIKQDRNILSVIIKAFKVMCLIQLFWIPLQYLSYHKFGIDINDAIFVNTLHLLENASFIRSWVYYPSGLTWHSAVLAPMFVLAFVLFKNIFIKALILVDVMICGNSTSLIGAFMCAALLFAFWIIYDNKYIKLKRKTLIAVIVVIIIVAIALVGLDIGESLFNSFVYLWERLFGGGYDSSTSAHLSYYMDYPKIVENSSLFQVLFGYGYGCSGYPITVMYNRYTTLTNWAVESDIMNILISRGIIGFVGYYGFLFYVAIKGWKIDYRYFIVMITIMIQGFGYNIQWDYVFFMEILMFFTIKLGINFFEPVSIFNKKIRLRF